MVLSLKDILRIQEERLSIETEIISNRPTAPVNISVTGLKFGFKIQWSSVNGVAGYRVAISPDDDLSSPELLITVSGEKSMEFNYFVGDVALTRFFAVQSILGDLFSNFSSVVSATSKGAGGAADGTPAAPLAPSPTPETQSEPGVGDTGLGGVKGTKLVF